MRSWTVSLATTRRTNVPEPPATPTAGTTPVAVAASTIGALHFVDLQTLKAPAPRWRPGAFLFQAGSTTMRLRPASGILNTHAASASAAA